MEATVYLWYYYGVINLFLLILMGVDKRCAIKQKRRIPERTLLLLSLAGGGLGGFLGMVFFHHKSRKGYFAVVFIISIVLHFYLLQKLIQG